MRRYRVWPGGNKLAETLERDPASAGRPKSVSCDKTELKMQIVGKALYECNVATLPAKLNLVYRFDGRRRACRPAGAV